MWGLVRAGGCEKSKHPADVARTPPFSFRHTFPVSQLPAKLSASNLAALLLLLIIAAIRFAFVIDTEQYPYIDDLAGDTRPYRERATEIVSGEWVGDEVYFDSPIFPYFLALTGGHLGGSELAPKLVQALLDTGTAWLVFRLTFIWFGPGAALLSLFMYGFYGFVLFYNGILLKPVLTLFLLTMSVYLLQRKRATPSGFLLGLSILARGNLLLFLPVMLFFAWKNGGSRKAATRLAIAALLPLLLVTARNGVVGHDLVFLTYHAGPTFYHGNNPNARGTYSPIIPGRQNPPYEKRDAIRIAEQRAGQTLKPSEINRFWFAEAGRFIASDPLRFLRLTGRRAFLFWDGREIPDTYDFVLYKSLFPLLNVAAVPFGVLAPLAILGWFLPGRIRGGARILPALVIVLFLSLAVLFVFGRYRLPAVPLLMPTAARFLYFVGGSIAARRLWPAAPLLVAMGAMLFLGNSFGETPDRTAGLYNLGIRMERLGRYAEAEALYREALEHSPRFANGWNNLGGILLRSGAEEDGESAFRSAVSYDPGHARAHANLAEIERARGSYEAAREHLERSLATDRTSETLLALAVVEELAGRRDDAAPLYEEAWRLDKGNGEAAANLGRLLYHGGDPARARPILEAAMEHLPGRVLPALYLGLALVDLGDLEKADSLVVRINKKRSADSEPPDGRLLLLEARIARERGEVSRAAEALDSARRAGLPSSVIIDLIAGRNR